VPTPFAAQAGRSPSAFAMPALYRPCGKGWNFLRFLRNRRFLLRYFAMRPQNTRSANLQKRCLVNFRLLRQRNSPDFSENENHVLGRIAL